MVIKTLQEAAGIPHPTYVGGGTDLMPLLKNRVRNDKDLVFLNQLKELRGIEARDGFLYLGAGETLYDLERSSLVAKTAPAAAQAAAATASPQIRSVATLGGNVLQDRRCIYFNQSSFWRGGLPPCFKTGGRVCHQAPNSPVCRAIYYSDVATALLLYQAEAECLEGDERRWVPVAELIRRHSQANGLTCNQHLPVLVVRFRLPVPPPREHSGFYKYAMRASIDFPLINFAMRCGGGRPAKVVAGAVAPQPVLLEETARLLDTSASDDEILAACEEEMKKLAMPIREACIPPARKRELFRHLVFLLRLRTTP